MTRILVTGSLGMLGSSLVPHLRRRGHDVCGHARGHDSDLSADLTSGAQVAAMLDEAAPEVIINLAALANVDDCERQPQEAYRSNVLIVENVAAWIRARGVGCHLVQISTDQVYDGPGPHRESDVRLTNYYGFTKYAGELAAARVPSTVLRTNFVGRSDCATKASLSDWLVQSLTAGTPVTVFEDVQFSPLSMQHLVELFEVVADTRSAGVYNLGSRDGMSKADFAEAFAEALELPTASMTRGSSTAVKAAAYRPKDMRMDSSRFEQTFNVELPTLRQEIHSMTAAYA